MDPYALRSNHERNLDTYRQALAGAADAEVELLTRLVEMELALVAETGDLIVQLEHLRAEQVDRVAERPAAVR